MLPALFKLIKERRDKANIFCMSHWPAKRAHMKVNMRVAQRATRNMIVKSMK
jgi:hypothetical protein